MNLLLNRLYDNGNDTLGILYYPAVKSCKYVYTLEDTYRPVKVQGQTRIPAGQYKIDLRKEGGFYERFCQHKNLAIRELTKKFGMLELQDVPGYKYVLIHTGNDAEDTEGCIIVGNKPVNNSNIKNGYLEDSTGAYIEFVRYVYDAMGQGKQIILTIMDVDRQINKQFGV